MKKFREEKSHTPGTATNKRAGFLSSTATLAVWRVGQNRLLLLLVGVGLLVALTLVCVVPLMSEVTMTAGLRDTLTASPDNGTLTVSMDTAALSTSAVQGLQKLYLPSLQRALASYLKPTVDFSITKNLSLVQQGQPIRDYSVLFHGTDIAQARPHMHLLQGQYPPSTSSDGELDVMMTPDTAQALHVHVGSTLTFCFYIGNADLQTFCTDRSGSLVQVRVSGLFNTTPDSFWHGMDFLPVPAEAFVNGQTAYYFLFANDELLHIADKQAASSGQAAVVTFFQPFSLTWDYSLDPARIIIDQLDDLRSRLASLQADLTNKFSLLHSSSVSIFDPLDASFFGRTLTTPTSVGLLDTYDNHIAVTRIPVLLLSLQLVALILFFVSLITDLLVDRQTEAIAVMRSRGASGWQVFGALMMQCSGLCVLAMLLAPLAALLVTYIVVAGWLGSAELSAFASSASNPVRVLGIIGLYLLVTLLVALVAMALALWRTTGLDVLRVRRESARSTQRPLWQRFYLDVLAGIVALVGYATSLYLGSVGGLLNVRTHALASAPLTLIAPMFLVIGCMLLFLRIFPLLLQLGARIAVRGRGAPSLLAFAQMARAPGRAVRMSMLLALTLAFSIFTLIFTATQSQRIYDLASYETGADFSGTLPASLQMQSVDNVVNRYGAIPGVQASSAGFVGSGATVGAIAVPMRLIAVDSTSFGKVGIWPEQASGQSLESLMGLLTAQRGTVTQKNAVPVIVDAVAGGSLALHIGSTFSLSVDGLVFGDLNCVVVGEVEHIPTINNSANIGTGTQQAGGILLDYRGYNTFYQSISNILLGIPDSLPLNHVWLKARDDQQSQAQVREALDNSSLAPPVLLDRQQVLASLTGDPLYLNLVSVLVLGTAAAFSLALLGDLLASWLGARMRLNSFVILRALGSSPEQVITVLTWEQGVIYITALLLGVGFGALLSATLIPTLLLNNAPASGPLSSLNVTEFYVLQHILPGHLVIPASLIVVGIVLVIVCVVALGMMVRIVTRPVPGQVLRINED